MDGPQFDAWTRRRLGMSLGSALAAIWAVRQPAPATAKLGKKRCTKLGRECSAQGKKCCGKLRCDLAGGQGKTLCCKRIGKTCASFEECCGQTNCGCVSSSGPKVCTQQPLVPCPA